MNPYDLEERTHNCICNNAKMVQYRLPKKVIDGKCYCEIDNLATIVRSVIYRSIAGDHLGTSEMDVIINLCSKGIENENNTRC